MTLSYLTKAEAATALTRFDSTITADDILDWDIALAEGRVNTELEHARIETPASDHSNFLKFATLFLLVDYLSQAGMIAHTTGRILISRLGRAVTRYNKENMFFMRTGDVRRPMRYMRDQETPSQMAMDFIYAYTRWYFLDDTGQIAVEPTISYDVTTGGHGYNRKTTEIDSDNTDSRAVDY
jgi:hypothetical protein